jgi:hypothetical protein
MGGLLIGGLGGIWGDLLCGGCDGTTLNAGGTFRHRERLRVRSDDGRSLEGVGAFWLRRGVPDVECSIRYPVVPGVLASSYLENDARTEENWVELR